MSFVAEVCVEDVSVLVAGDKLELASGIMTAWRMKMHELDQGSIYQMQWGYSFR